MADRASRRARVGSVAVGYLGVSWLVLQVVDVILGMFTLPGWVAPGVLVLLLIGLVMVTATAWVQADPATTEREEAGEVPSDWEVAPADALSVLATGRLPHLTWGRTLVGGVMALSLLFGVAGAWVLFTQGGRGVRPRVADGEGITRIAVLPFTTSGEGLDVYQEGMVELLSTNLDGLGGIRTIDSRTVLARWDDLVGPGRRPDLETSLNAAAATGATHALLGGMVSTGRDIRLTSQLYDLSTGSRIAEVQEGGPTEQTLALVDGLSVSVAREVLGSDVGLSETGIRLASITTFSVPALQLYLEAEALYRRGLFEQAVPLLDQALEEDPTFGLAVMRRAQAFGWINGVSPDTLEAARLAIRPLLDRLAPRDAIIAEGGIIAFADRDDNGVAMLRNFVARYPDEAEGWYQLSDFLFHLSDIRGGTREEILGGFDRAVELGPRFAPYYIHAVEGALIQGDRGRTRELLERYRALGGDEGRLSVWQTQDSLILGAALAAEEAGAGGGGMDVATALRGYVVQFSDRPQRVADLAETFLPRDDAGASRLLLRAGRWSELRSRRSPGSAADANLMGQAGVWVGAMDLDRESVARYFDGSPAAADPAWWLPAEEAAASVQAMLAARDDGTGANPLLLAHLAERAGDLELAARLFSEESWRDLGPAATYRLARIRERQGRQAEAVGLYSDFLEMWSGADEDIVSVGEARSAVARLSG